jgi:hypothetical protein
MEEERIRKINRGISYRELDKQRDLLHMCGTRSDFYGYLNGQIARFRVYENNDNSLLVGKDVRYVLSPSRSPSLQRKYHSRDSVDITISQLVNLYPKISADARIIELFKELKKILKPYCDHQQYLTLKMIKDKFERDQLQESLLLEQKILILSYEDVEKLVLTTFLKKLRNNAETLLTPIISSLMEKENKHTFLREDSVLRKIVKLFLNQLLKGFELSDSVEGFLRSFPKFPDRLKAFLNKLEILAEKYELEDPTDRGRKITTLIVFSYFIPRLKQEHEQKHALSVLHDNSDRNTKAYQKALSIFTWE